MSDSNISPLAKRLAEENNVDWRRLLGSGPEGRVVERDVLEYLARVMSGEESLDPTPEPLPTGMESWPEDDVKGFQPAARGYDTMTVAEDELDLSDFDGSRDSDPAGRTSGSDLPDSGSSGLSDFAGDFYSEETSLPAYETASDFDDDDLLEIDDDGIQGVGETAASPHEAPAPETWPQEPEDEPLIGEDLFLFDEPEAGGEPPIFADAPAASRSDDDLPVFGPRDSTFAGAGSSDDFAADSSDDDDLWPSSPAPAAAPHQDPDDEVDLALADETAQRYSGSVSGEFEEAGPDEPVPEAAEASPADYGLELLDTEVPEGAGDAELDPSPHELDDEGLDLSRESGEAAYSELDHDREARDLERDGSGFGALEQAPEDEEPLDLEDLDLASEGDSPADTEPLVEVAPAPALAARSNQAGQDAGDEAATEEGRLHPAAGVSFVSYGTLLRRHLDVTALAQAQAAVGRDRPEGNPVAPAAFLLRAAAKALRSAPLGGAGPVALAVISEQGVGARAFEDAAGSSFAALLAEVEGVRHSGAAGLEAATLVVADLSEYEIDEAVLQAGAPVLTLGRVLYDSTEGRYRSTLSLSGEVPLEQGAKLLAAVAELLDAPVRLVI